MIVSSCCMIDECKTMYSTIYEFMVDGHLILFNGGYTSTTFINNHGTFDNMFGRGLGSGYYDTFGLSWPPTYYKTMMCCRVSMGI